MTNQELNSIILSTLAADEPRDLDALEDDVCRLEETDDARNPFFPTTSSSRFRQQVLDRTSALLTETSGKRAVLCFVNCSLLMDPVVIR